MKVRTTFEVTDEQRMALGLGINGKFVMFTREEIEHWLQVTIASQLKEFDDVLAGVRDSYREQLKI